MPGERSLSRTAPSLGDMSRMMKFVGAGLCIQPGGAESHQHLGVNRVLFSNAGHFTAEVQACGVLTGMFRDPPDEAIKFPVNACRAERLLASEYGSHASSLFRISRVGSTVHFIPEEKAIGAKMFPLLTSLIYLTGFDPLRLGQAGRLSDYCARWR